MLREMAKPALPPVLYVCMADLMETLLGHNTEELGKVAEKLGQPAFRGRQLAQWLYRRMASSFDEMSDLPRGFREQLAAGYHVGRSRVAHRDVAPDGTVKYLLELSDCEQVESVYLPYRDRVSVCLSSQVGCPAGCTFCATAQGGLARNMTAGEIVGQILTVASENPDRRISHAVYMGMGEPLLNYDSVLKSVRLLVDEVGMSPRHITMSTVGVVPGILRLAEEDLPVTLALSLHAPDDLTRERLIPTARKWRIGEILDACRAYFEKTRRNLTFEYLVIADVNDRPQQARELARLLRGLPGNVNLIPFNYVETAEGFRRPSQESVTAFRAELEKAGRVTTQRMERGHAISAACGQLRRTSGTIRARDRDRDLAPLVAAPKVGATSSAN
jgi:23S rRNA (adenine2503-C2)-methyltransferase